MGRLPRRKRRSRRFTNINFGKWNKTFICLPKRISTLSEDEPFPQMAARQSRSSSVLKKYVQSKKKTLRNQSAEFPYGSRNIAIIIMYVAQPVLSTLQQAGTARSWKADHS